MEAGKKTEHWYLHVDLDAFFASVEQLDNPELRGKPVIVGGKPEDRRSVVSTASYEARAFGVHSAMPVFQAYRLCPQGIFVHGRMHRYAELSHQIMNIFRDYSPDVDQMSIDEAFIDLTGTEKLFGLPEETARKIKARVKEETGLTVSVGLATTKYLAKIASGLSKPDGFYQIKSGEEESFMLKLPLNKVWGLGPKSLELIRSKGINTTRDIYEKDYDTLEFLFGKNMAGFLFNVVRGAEKESFNREAKSHSISAETTFPYDLTDIYTIETELLELAHGVFFRLLKEESFSRTAFVKIRYDDFSTCTVQETVERNIITLDSFFEIIKRLFEKRYENGRGIRLLGLGFENIVKEEKPYQQDLFSSGNDEKKQAVEKAILKLSKKHPEIKVSKARTLKALLFAILIGFGANEIKAEEIKVKNPKPAEEVSEPPLSLFDYDINDKNHVDFTASGLWKVDFTSGFDVTFGNGSETAFSPMLPVFKQETDISTLLTLNDSWYFEAAFADEFTKNTLAFGYKGNGLVRHFRLANRGIVMDQGYSAEHFGYSLRGGNNQAPGMSLQLKSPSEKIQADFLLRYDMTETRSESYYGMNRVSDIKKTAGDFAWGRDFYFPKEASAKLKEIDSVFVENIYGSYSDSKKKYRKLRNDEYTVFQNHLYISKEAGGGKDINGHVPSILVTFNYSATPSSIISDCGSWNDENSFFGKIQKELGCGGKYKISDYCREMLATIQNTTALVIQKDEAFSPFLCPDLYDFGKLTQADYLVIADKSEMPVTKFKALETEDLYPSLFENFFEEKSSCVKIINKDTPESLYPFAEDCPEIYLGFAQKTDIAVRARSYSPVTELAISKNAAAGTVQVYKNGNLLTGSLYNENTGVIELNSPVSQTDHILITWQEESSDFNQGAVSAASGMKIQFLPELSADIALTTRQTVNKDNQLAQPGKQTNSFTALSAGLAYENYGLSLTEKTAISLLNDNTTEGLLLYSWDDLIESYNKEKDNNPEAKIQKPESLETISFKPQSFSAYKKISVDFKIQNESNTSCTGPLWLILDEDTGTNQKGNESLFLYIRKFPKELKAGKTYTITIVTDKKTILLDGYTLQDEDCLIKIDKKVIPSRLKLESNDDSQKFLIKKLTYDQAQYYGSLQNYTAAAYKKEGSLIKVNDFEVAKDLFISAESEQGSGNLLDPDPFVNIKAQGGITLSGIQLAADAAMQDVTNEQKLSEAGHSIKTDKSLFLFKIISAEENYRYIPYSNELRKDNAFGLDFSPLNFSLKTNLKTNAYDAFYHSRQNSEISAAYSQKISDIEFGIEGKLDVSQKLLPELSSSQIKKLQTSQALTSYSDGWLQISELEFSSGKADALLRNTLWAAGINGCIPLASSTILFKPKLSYELSDNYNRTDESPFISDKEYLSLMLPFSTEKKSIGFEISRTGGGKEKTLYGGSYASDTEKLFVIQKERRWFYSSIPFYELFDAHLSEKVTAEYMTKYEGNFRRSLFNSKKDIIIPSALTLALSREIKNQIPVTDVYQIKTVITNNSVNNFGKNSISKNFNWFEQEELTTSLTTLFKIPTDEPENCRIRIQTYLQLLLFITEKSIFTEQFNFSIENAGDWNVQNSLAYQRPSQTSLITSFINSTFPGARNTDYSISRKDTFSFEAGKTNAVFQQKYSYNHTLGIDFLEHYNVNAGLGGNLVLNEKLADSISISISLGAKAEF